MSHNSLVKLGWQYDVEIVNPDGSILLARALNAVFEEGLEYIAKTMFVTPEVTSGHHIVLLSPSFSRYSDPTFKMVNLTSAHEITSYSASERPEWTPAWVKPKVTNAAAKASITFTDAATISGIMLATSSAKNDTSGVALSAGAFDDGNLRVSAGATASITATLTLSSL